MNLINVNQSESGMSVDGRELHEFLEVGSRFNDWIRNRIEKYGFVEGEDYRTVTKNLVSGGNQIDYDLSIETAKELCMVENNEKGKQARRYFIECEKRLKKSNVHVLPQNYKEALVALVSQVEENERLQSVNIQLVSKIEDDSQKVKFADTCMDSDKSILVRELAKLASKNGVVIGEHRLYKRMRDWELICKGKCEPTQKGMALGLFEVVKGVHQTPKGARDYHTTKVTAKGQAYIINKLHSDSVVQ